MGKFLSLFSLVLVAWLCILLPSCGSGNPTKVVPEVVPTNVTITPSPVISLAVGETQAFTATPRNDSFTFQSSNPTVLTIARNGQACAGTWNSLAAPQVCTPGPVGVAQVTASTLGVTSPVVTVYVHAPITNISISKVPGQPQTLSDSCLSKGSVHGPEKWLFQANAFNGTTDITSTVGPFSWQVINPGAVSIFTPSAPANGTQGCLLSPSGQCLNQQAVTATTPGVGQLYATAAGVSSQPISIETCRVAQIKVTPANGQPQTSFLVSAGNSTLLDASVTDIVGQTLTNVPLTWSTSTPASVGAVGANTGGIFGSIGTVSASGAGAGTVIASCTPPTCNGGIKPSLPIYPQAAMNFQVQNTGTTIRPTVYASTTACTDPAANPDNAICTPTLVPITASSATAPFAAATPIGLPGSPNSLVFDTSQASAKAYLGVSSTQFGQRGLMIFDGSSVTVVTSIPGKVLATSPDHNSVIVSDTSESPNQVFICTSCSGASRSVTSFLISGATAAAFSPDSLKAYILAGNTLYVYSKADPLQTIQLGGAATDLTFHPEGGFAYITGPAPGITAYRVCDNSPISSADLSTANPPSMIRALPDGSSLLALEPPNIDLISLTSLTSTLCTGTVTDTITSFNLGQGNFVPTQFLVAPNGQSAYILGQNSSGRLPFVVVFNVSTQTVSTISLTGSSAPLSASLAPDGTLLFVGATDGSVHVIDTASGLDTQQVTFPFPTNELCFSPGRPATQVPLSQVTISAAAQNGGNTTYSYSLTSGPPLKVGENITVSVMSNGANDGTFTITALGTDSSGNPTFTVSNSLGVSAASQSGLGTVPITCNPDLLVVRP